MFVVTSAMKIRITDVRSARVPLAPDDKTRVLRWVNPVVVKRVEERRRNARVYILNPESRHAQRAS